MTAGATEESKKKEMTEAKGKRNTHPRVLNKEKREKKYVYGIEIKGKERDPKGPRRCIGIDLPNLDDGR